VKKNSYCIPINVRGWAVKLDLPIEASKDKHRKRASLNLCIRDFIMVLIQNISFLKAVGFQRGHSGREHAPDGEARLAFSSYDGRLQVKMHVCFVSRQDRTHFSDGSLKSTLAMNQSQ
jgi:hypothetical protein